MVEAATLASPLPHWDLSPFFPGLDSPEFIEGVAQFTGGIERLESLVVTTGAPEHHGQPVTDEVVAAFDELVNALNDTSERGMLLITYVSGFISVDTRNQVGQARMSELRQTMSRFSKISTRFTAWVGSLDVDALIERSALAREHAFLVRKEKVEAEHLMSQTEEDLAAEMTLSGGQTWGKLHDDLTSQIMVTVEKRPGEPEELPMSEVRNLAMEPDRDLRRRAYEAELAAWKLWETPIAAALNGVKGEHTTLAKRRGWDAVLDQAVFQNNIDRPTLDAMMGAARDAFPDIRRYLHAKAKALGVDRLAWYDLSAPLSANDRVWEWHEAVDFINEQFGTYSPKMRDLAERAFRERWIDAEPRAGKVGGGFCMPMRGDESRILVNYTPAFDGASTLAHELGHAYHNLCEADVSMWQRMATPMTLAETASTFCETILRQAAIAAGDEQEQLTILEGTLQDATAIVVDITSRFLFEHAVISRRTERELSADEFSELMLDAQRETYGDGLDSDLLHPYMWAVKPHYYSANSAFYNYPYMFGLLFGLGLYARYQDDPDSFRASYDDLLAATGSADAATLAGRFGIDIQTPDFWTSSLDVIRADIDKFVTLVDQRG